MVLERSNKVFKPGFQVVGLSGTERMGKVNPEGISHGQPSHHRRTITLPSPRAVPNVRARFRLAQSAIAMVVTIGSTPLARGKIDTTITYKPLAHAAGTHLMCILYHHWPTLSPLRLPSCHHR
ncbi:hypothetical protein Pdw03_6089 [Penicillium digitatum]|uniref:Uncharacterized protein n=1 Tax=Penicillium digitatum TaxID=36651 RepID=A0A7T7BQK5_PENDI|nr:hypothetical protein Pdw03_6089 [Penicillium digitatum]